MRYVCQTVYEYSQRLENGSILRETVDSFKMAKQEWSRIEIEGMIVEYEGRSSLWDVCSPEYRDRNKKTRSLDNFSGKVEPQNWRSTEEDS